MCNKWGGLIIDFKNLAFFGAIWPKIKLHLALKH